MNAEMLEVDCLTKVFPTRSGSQSDDFIAVDQISFQLSRGGSLGIVGESGSGKTTTARIIVGLESATSGDIRFDGEHVGARSGVRYARERARRMQMVFQDPFASLDPRQTLESALHELLSLHFRRSAAWRNGRIDELFDQVGLDARYRGVIPRNLSGGQRQRFAIARALAMEPELLILDEAVSALDVSVQAQVLNLLSDLRTQLGISYLFVSHDLGVIRQITDTCVVMRRGAIVEQGATGAILDRPQHLYTRRLLDAVPRPGWVPSRQQALPA